MLKLIYHIFFFMICFVVNFALAAPNVSPTQETSFQIHILPKCNCEKKPKLDDELEDILPSSIFEITENDIENYNWPDQSILLTSESSRRLIKLMEKQYVPLEQYQYKFPKQPKSWFYALMVETVLSKYYFFVFLNGKKLYSGVFLNSTSAWGASYPIIYPMLAKLTSLSPLEAQIMLVVRPEHRPLSMIEGYKKLGLSIKKRIEIKEVQNFFKIHNKVTFHDEKDRVERWLPKIKSNYIQQ